jgi:acyl-CoA thioester hydrolase/thioesterase-3
MYATFETEIIVRPDDIDMNQHVHNSRYMDYVLMARYDQMERCYGMSMQAFIDAGYSWVTSRSEITYKRPLRMGDVAIVRTHIDTFLPRGVRVAFAIYNKSTLKECASGVQDYVMISIASGRSVDIPQWIIDVYSISA